MDSDTGANALTRADFVLAVQADLELVKLILAEDHRELHVKKIDRAIVLIDLLHKEE